MERTTPAEEWRSVVGWPTRWEISNLGRVRDAASKRIKQPQRLGNRYHDGGGYLFVGLPLGRGKYRPGYIHRLVLTAFVRSPRAKEEGNHLDGDPTNNRLDNLEWTSRSENQLHSVHVLKRAGPLIGKRGEANHMAKLNTDQVREIRRRWPETSIRALGIEFGVAKRTIDSIVKGVNWKHVI